MRPAPTIMCPRRQDTIIAATCVDHHDSCEPEALGASTPARPSVSDGAPAARPR